MRVIGYRDEPVPGGREEMMVCIPDGAESLPHFARVDDEGRVLIGGNGQDARESIIVQTIERVRRLLRDNQETVVQLIEDNGKPAGVPMTLRIGLLRCSISASCWRKLLRPQRETDMPTRR